MSKTRITQAEWQRKYRQLSDIAERISHMRWERAVKVWRDATGYEWNGCCVHNAAVSDVGQGWGAGPNGRATIKAARHAERILATQWDGSRIVDAWHARHEIVYR